MRKSTRQAAKRAAKARLSGGIISSESSPKNKKIVFGDFHDVDAPIDNVQNNKEDEVNVDGSAAGEGVGSNNDGTTDIPDIDEDDEDAVEEVKGSSARESTQRLRDEERKQAKESNVSKKRRKKKNDICIEEKVEDYSKEDDHESSDDSEEDEDDEDILTDSFFEMVDSERATQIQLAKKEKKQKKIQQKKRLGKHTTFVVEDEYKMGGDTPHRTDQTNIEVVPIGGGSRAESNNETSSNTTNVDEERQLIISATLGSKPSKSATLFARGSLTCGASKERGSDSRKRKSKNEETWKRSKKLKRLGVGSRPGQAATLFVCKKKQKKR